MWHKMRRENQQLTEQETIEILEQGTSGVLAVAGDMDYPYAVPIGYVYHDGKIYFHCAKSGHKIDAIKRNPKVSFCVVAQDEVVPEKYATRFRSVIAFGKATILSGEDMRRPIELLAAKYTPDDEAGRMREIEKDYPALCMIVLNIEHMTGKKNKDM